MRLALRFDQCGKLADRAIQVVIDDGDIELAFGSELLTRRGKPTLALLFAFRPPPHEASDELFP